MVVYATNVYNDDDVVGQGGPTVNSVLTCKDKKENQDCACVVEPH
jgi:hypothetical protein